MIQERADIPVLVVGSAALDTISTPTERVEDEIGGSALYFAAAAGTIAPVRVVAVVGGDFPWAKIDFLRGRGVDLDGIERAEGKTFRWKGVYHADMEGRDTLATELNVFAEFRPRIPPHYRATSHVFLGNIDPDLQLNVLESLPEASCVALDTMNFWIEGSRAALDRVLARASVVILNESEARLLTGRTSLTQAARAVAALGPRRVVIKKGSHGAMLWDGDGFFQCPAVPLENVIDPTGAGDCFAGGFMGYLAAHPSPRPEHYREALVYGNVLASFSVESFGLGGLSQITPGDVEARRRTLLATLPGNADRG